MSSLLTDARRFTVAAWVLAVAVVGGLEIALSSGARADDIVGSSTVLFWVFTPAAVIAAVLADRLLAAAREHNHAELGLLGAFLWAYAMFRGVHAFTAADVVYDANSASATAAFLSLPVALIAAAPLFAAHTALSRRIARGWRWWALAWTFLAFGTAIWMFAGPRTVFDVPTSLAVRRGIEGLALLAGLALAARALRRHLASHNRAMLALTLALTAVALGALEWWPAAAGTKGWWLAQFVGAAGMLALGPAALRALRADEAAWGLLSPLNRRDPLAAAELAESPVIRSFVRSTEQRPISLEHAVRVTELALRAGERARLPHHRITALAQAAMLHDLGKVTLPDLDLMPAPEDPPSGALRTHAALGSESLARRHELAAAAAIVRGHHERIDGTGYPDELADTDIPPEARLLAICDAYDTVAHSSPSGHPLGDRNAREVLRRLAGVHYDEIMVDLVLRVIDAGDPITAPPSMPAPSPPDRWLCPDAVPESLREAAASVHRR